MHNTTTIRHFAVGHLGQPVGMFTNTSSTALVWRGVHNGYDIEQTVSTESHNVRFPGQYDILGNGLYYNYHRDYDPSLGRYIQSDPIGLSGGLNTYGYVGANPLMGVDPLGLCKDNLNPFHIIGEEWSRSYWDDSETSDLRNGMVVTAKATISVLAVPYRAVRTYQNAGDAADISAYLLNGDYDSAAISIGSMLFGRSFRNMVPIKLDPKNLSRSEDMRREAVNQAVSKSSEQVMNNACECGD